MQTSLRGIANRAKKDGKARFRNLYGLLDENNLRECFYRLKRNEMQRFSGPFLFMCCWCQMSVSNWAGVLYPSDECLRWVL